MAVYVPVVLLSMLIILSAVLLTSNAARRSQLQTAMDLKQSYEADNSRAAEIYAELTSSSTGGENDEETPKEPNYIYIEEFETLPSYANVSTTWTASNSILTLTATGNDPRVNMYNITSFDPKIYRYIEVRYNSNTNTTMEFFMIENPTDQTYAVSGDIIGDGEWHILTIDLWTNEEVKNRDNITGCRWDWCTGDTVIMDVDYIKIKDIENENSI